MVPLHSFNLSLSFFYMSSLIFKICDYLIASFNIALVSIQTTAVSVFQGRFGSFSCTASYQCAEL